MENFDLLGINRFLKYIFNNEKPYTSIHPLNEIDSFTVRKLQLIVIKRSQYSKTLY